jgi:hypothetical protein
VKPEKSSLQFLVTAFALFDFVFIYVEGSSKSFTFADEMLSNDSQFIVSLINSAPKTSIFLFPAIATGEPYIKHLQLLATVFDLYDEIKSQSRVDQLIQQI